VKLIVTEKYKQALNIAKALGKYKIINKRYLNKNIKIIISPNYIILPLLGHITEYGPKAEYVGPLNLKFPYQRKLLDKI
jgi:DNA topoisomerase IA